MSQAKLELDHDGIQQLLKSKEVEDVVHDKSREIAARLGSAYETDVKQMQTRVISSVFTTDKRAISDILENNTLLKAVSQ